MKTSLMAVSLLIASLVVFSPTFAAPIDFIDNGTYTTDINSGYDWLDVTASRNQSYNYVSSQFGFGGVYEGWRYATQSEFRQLIGSWFSQDWFVDAPSTWSEFYAFFGTFGQTGYDFPLFETRGMLQNDLGTTAGAFDGVVYFHETHGFWGANIELSGLALDDVVDCCGSYLIRDTLITTPIPAAVFMFVPALLGFFGLRRKLQA